MTAALTFAVLALALVAGLHLALRAAEYRDHHAMAAPPVPEPETVVRGLADLYDRDPGQVGGMLAEIAAHGREVQWAATLGRPPGESGLRRDVLVDYLLDHTVPAYMAARRAGGEG
ncbi:hypothetical protein [Streptomyces sp. URMC 129]|uniref:hypothetical protein n=1 Tax=Streptomyces sp. URMC 129 TaxID=3423407 RepID=UPI003F1B8DD1